MSKDPIIPLAFKPSFVMRYQVPISVIMPCYNSERFVYNAIQSILEQTFPDFELIIVNDGSTDGTASIIQNIHDSRIRYLELPVNKGNYTARNAGMEMAKGKYTCVMDSDDWSYPYRLQHQFDFLENHKSVACAGGFCEIIDEEERISGVVRRPLTSSEIKVNLFRDNCIIHPTIMFRSHLVHTKKMVYNDKMRYASDFDFMVRLSEQAPVRNMDEILIRYRSHPGQITQNKRAEQAGFADGVRIRQLEKLGIKPSKKEAVLHLNLMKGSYIEDDDLLECENWLNKIMEANFVKKIHNDTLLFKLLQNAMNMAVYVNSWAIEKQMVQFIKQQFPQTRSILEFGSGEGTNYLLETFKVTSIEHDPGFCMKRGKNHQCIFTPIHNNWYHREIVKDILRKPHDLILVDGPPRDLRKGILENIDLFEGLQCPIIFDDANRETDKDTIEVFCQKLNLSYSLVNGRNKDFAVVC